MYMAEVCFLNNVLCYGIKINVNPRIDVLPQFLMLKIDDMVFSKKKKMVRDRDQIKQKLLSKRKKSNLGARHNN